MAIRTRKIGGGGLYLKAIIYGHFGVGKTLLACTAGEHPDMFPVLVVNIEGGGITASNIPNVTETEQLGGYSDVEEVFWKLANKDVDEEDEDGPRVDWGAFKTVVIDSGSAVQDMNIMEVARANATAKKSASRISQQDWGDSTRQVGELLRRFKALPMHVIVTARQRDGYPEGFDDAKKATVGPTTASADFTPALRRHVNHTFDHVWAMTADSDGQRWLLPADNGTYKAKTRGPAFQAKMGDALMIRNPSDPESEGMAIPEIFNLFKQTQGSKQ